MRHELRYIGPGDPLPPLSEGERLRQIAAETKEAIEENRAGKRQRDIEEYVAAAAAFLTSAREKIEERAVAVLEERAKNGLSGSIRVFEMLDFRSRSYCEGIKVIVMGERTSFNLRSRYEPKTYEGPPEAHRLRTARDQLIVSPVGTPENARLYEDLRGILHGLAESQVVGPLKDFCIRSELRLQELPGPSISISF